MLFTTLGLAGCGDFPCSNEMLQTLSSPDLKMTAYFFERNCGATTPYERIVMLSPQDKPINYRAFESWIFVSEGQPNLHLAWENPQNLKVTITDVPDIKKKLTDFRGITITYAYAPNEQ